MAKRGRGSKIDDDDEDLEFDSSFTSHSRRARAVVSYREDDDDEDDDLDDDKVKPDPNDTVNDEDVNGINDTIEDIPPPQIKTKQESDAEDYLEDEDDEYDDQPKTRKRKSKKTKPARQIHSDDDFEGGDFEDEEDDIISEDDDFVDKLQRKNFIASDDDANLSEDYGYGDARKKKKRKTTRSRSRSAEPKFAAKANLDDADLTKEDEEPDDIQKELAELYDSSPDASPIKHKLRDRNQAIDYTIPPPITNETQLFNKQLSPINIGGRGRKGRPSTNKSEYRKILFPTAGPFGGSDVISLFGTNIPPGGIPIPGMTNDNGLTAIGQNLSDSDSSDEEIAPVNGEATISKKPAKSLLNGGGANGGFANNSNMINNTKLITAGSSDPNAKDGKKKNNLSDTDPLGIDMNIDFTAVGGLDNYINQLKEMVALPLLYPELYQNFGITPPRGVLFHGPPGTGKTLMARALAASCSTAERKITFFMRKGADCLSKWVGEAERQLRLLFEEAKNQQPAIIFFDEIDGLAPVRSSKQEQIHASIVSTLLALMDGMDNRGQVIVIGATNRPDSIDPALRRPGRFDREFYFPLPDINARKEILKIQTRKWTPPLQDTFVEKIAELTKGYGGADLRALCTEAALNSIQRKYPQIYQTNEKLQVHPAKVKIIAKDFMKAIEKIVPSSARSSSTGSAPLPDHLKPLLQDSLLEITTKLSDLLPNSIGVPGQKKLTALDEALYFDPSINDADGGFSRQQLLRNLEGSRICKPHLLVSGGPGNGQQYISGAILNHLEGFQVQSLDMGNVFGDSTRTPESSIVQAFIEARRSQPSILFIPNIDVWFEVVPYSARATLSSLLRSLKSTEKILLLGVSETSEEELSPEIKILFGINSIANNVNLHNPNVSQRQIYFESLLKTLSMKPYEFINDLQNRPKRKLKTLKVIKDATDKSSAEIDKKKLKQIEYNDAKLKNVLKIKLAGLMDLFKNRYKRFKKPIIDENLLYHLFDPTVIDNPLHQYEVLYVKSEDPKHENMILELTTGRFFHNMDLDIIEERLWNGYYSEPKQFLKDIKMIVKDSITSGDRERILKANEMLTNAQFGIDDFSTPDFVNACRDMRARELERQEKLLQDHKKLTDEFRRQSLANIKDLSTIERVDSGNEEIAKENGHVEDPIVIDEVKENGSAAPLEGLLNEKVEAEKQEQVEPQPEPQPVTEAITEVVTETVQEVIREDATEPITSVTEKSDVDPLDSAMDIDTGAVVDEDIDSESEIEDVDIDTEKPLDLNQTEFDSFYQDLLQITNNYNVERLEIVMAKLMDIIWADRGVWDKSDTINKLRSVITSVKNDMKNGS
ncbi:hypothetical protein DFJ63DRAFT_319338 [Scheffersomyces coipomensis]|uniref:uncharacterized protein n=1 Tax=Scheffersomyces coipomensis TaxID=1788519 RepID=UPI00315CFFD4